MYQSEPSFKGDAGFGPVPQGQEGNVGMTSTLGKEDSTGSLDQHDRDEGVWTEVLVEDRNTVPADIAASRIDFTEWMKTLPTRDRRVAETLAIGETATDAAKRFAISPARINQLRRELKESWQEFVGEPATPALTISSTT